MPADYSAAPAADYVELRLKSQGYWPTDPIKQQLAREGVEATAVEVAEEFETRVCWGPFFGQSSFESRDFDAPEYDEDLSLRGAILELESVKLWGREISAASVGCIRTYIGGSSFRPITALRMPGRWGGAHSGLGLSYNVPTWNTGGDYVSPVSVVARWGVTDTWPADVWGKILSEAVSNMLTQIENLQSIGSISQAGFSKSYDVVGIVTQKDLFTATRTFDKYARLWLRKV